MKSTYLLIPLLLINFHLFGETEIHRYKRTIGGKHIEYDTAKTALHKEGDRSWYTITYASSESLTETDFLLPELLPTAQTRHNFTDEREYTDKLEIRKHPENDGTLIPVIELGDLFFLLRFYPFEEPEDKYLYFVAGDRNITGDMKFRVEMEGEETIKIEGKEYEAYLLGLNPEFSGIMRVLAPVIPKIRFWYSKDDLPVMLKFSGVVGLGKQNTMVVELIEN
ncbi:MAG: hypothetical protein PQJ59_03375 [Spirochaetales bacterium]|nr:hypothetical protein [Spirochaetales bacterium]